jgi:hypothetical protein
MHIRVPYLSILQILPAEQATASFLFDGKKERFIDNDEANKLLKNTYRENYTVPDKV